MASRRPKRPENPNQLGKLIVDLSAGEKAEHAPLPSDMKAESPMNDNARITRLAALLAANGFAFVKTFELSEQKQIQPEGALFMVALVLSGLCGAYAALSLKPGTYWARMGEIWAFLPIGLAVFAWILRIFHLP